jgi:dUTPase
MNQERNRMKIRIVNKSKVSLPEYSTAFSAGMDYRINIENDIIHPSPGRAFVKTDCRGESLCYADKLIG